MTDMPPYLSVKDEEKSGEPDSDSSDFEDDLPLSFNKPRHLEPIKGAEREEHTWRVKEKVSVVYLFGKLRDVIAYHTVVRHVTLKTNAHVLYDVVYYSFYTSIE